MVKSHLDKMSNRINSSRIKQLLIIKVVNGGNYSTIHSSNRYLNRHRSIDVNSQYLQFHSLPSYQLFGNYSEDSLRKS